MPGEKLLSFTRHYSQFPGVISAHVGLTVGQINLGPDATVAQLAALESALGDDPFVASVE